MQDGFLNTEKFKAEFVFVAVVQDLRNLLGDENNERTTGGLAIWRGDEYILNFLFAISSSPGLTFTIEL